ncbi:MAG: histidinol-phosphatase [Lachnospiraceae bacterium]
MKTNYHTHTDRCKHAKGKEEDYVKAAIDCGLSILGFSDHAPFPDTDFGLRMVYEELDDYLSCIDTMANRYDNQITLQKGLEIEYLPQYNGYYEWLLTEKKLDYLLLGEHFFYSGNGDFCNVFNVTSIPDTTCYLDYAKAVTNAMKTGLFKMVAHPDIFLMNPYAWDKNCEKAVDSIIETALITNTILEYNANGLRREKKEYPDGIRHPYPHDNFWKKVSETSIEVIVGSDCHTPELLWDTAVETAYKNLASFGITPIHTI